MPSKRGHLPGEEKPPLKEGRRQTPGIRDGGSLPETKITSCPPVVKLLPVADTPETFDDFLTTPEEKLNWAWLAGIIDGEGSITIVIQSPKYRKGGISPSSQLRVRVKMTHAPTIEHIQTVAHCGTTYPCKPRPNCKPAFVWDACSREAAAVLRRCLPFLVTKKKQAQVALQFAEIALTFADSKTVPSGILAQRQGCADQLKALNQEGKPQRIK